LLVLAVELTNIHTARLALQDSLDAATLAAARSHFTTDAERTTLAQSFVEQNISDRFKGMVSGVSIVTCGADSEITQGRATITVPLSFACIIGMNQQAVPMLSEVKSAADGKLEMALALDTTGSMGTGGRIAALKVAAKDLVNEVMDGENVQIAVVPFAKCVNIGMDNRNEPGLTIPADIPGSKSCQWLGEKGPINCKDVTER
jgi:Flp pilus assembly protein TadG